MCEFSIVTTARFAISFCRHVVGTWSMMVMVVMMVKLLSTLLSLYSETSWCSCLAAGVWAPSICSSPHYHTMLSHYDTTIYTVLLFCCTINTTVLTVVYHIDGVFSFTTYTYALIRTSRTDRQTDSSIIQYSLFVGLFFLSTEVEPHALPHSLRRGVSVSVAVVWRERVMIIAGRVALSLV